MKVIRDEQFFGMAMIPLFQQHGIKRCNVSKCELKPSTIVTDCVNSDGESIDFALCEAHYQECKTKGSINYTLDFDL